jgi:hypothetical protein
MSNAPQIKDLLAIPSIANFTPKIPILRLPENNYITIKNQICELRLFTFYMVKPIDGVTTFEDFVRLMNLQDKFFEKATQLKYIVPLYFAINDGNVYVNISLLPTF